MEITTLITLIVGILAVLGQAKSHRKGLDQKLDEKVGALDSKLTEKIEAVNTDLTKKIESGDASLAK